MQFYVRPRILKTCFLIGLILLFPIPTRSFDNTVSLNFDDRNNIDLIYERRIGNVGLELNPGLFSYLASVIRNEISSVDILEYRPSLGVSYYVHLADEFFFKPELDVGYYINEISCKNDNNEGDCPNTYVGPSSGITDDGNYLFETLKFNGQMNFNRVSAGLYVGGVWFRDEMKITHFDPDVGIYSGINF
jgi:hypothetical protein